MKEWFVIEEGKKKRLQQDQVATDLRSSWHISEENYVQAHLARKKKGVVYDVLKQHRGEGSHTKRARKGQGEENARDSFGAHKSLRAKWGAPPTTLTNSWDIDTNKAGSWAGATTYR